MQSRQRVDIEVVICAYTLARWDRLVAAVRSVERQRHAARGVIVVIDHSEELLARAIEAFGDHRVVPNRHRRGLSGARNSGIEVSEAEVVAFLDDDAEADEGWLECFAALLEDPTVAGVGGRVDPAWETAPPAWFPEEFLWVVGCSYRGLPDGVQEIRNPIGANMAFRRAAMVDVGGFREEVGRVGTLPAGCEETELSIQVRRTGSRILYAPAATVRHHVPPERGRWRYFWTRCLHEGRSKAAVARLTGASDALESERRYASRVLPAGVARAAAGAVRGPGRRAAAGRAGAIVAGLATTAVGYAQGRTGLGVGS